MNKFILWIIILAAFICEGFGIYYLFGNNNLPYAIIFGSFCLKFTILAVVFENNMLLKSNKEKVVGCCELKEVEDEQAESESEEVEEDKEEVVSVGEENQMD